MANNKIKITIIILVVLFAAIVIFFWFKERKIIIPPIVEESNLGGLTYSVSGKELTKEQYDILKVEIKDKIAKRDKTLPNNIEVQQWIDIMNTELKKCVLKNVKKLDIDIINNNCL